jgi:hypothetical protein
MQTGRGRKAHANLVNPAFGKLTRNDIFFQGLKNTQA